MAGSLLPEVRLAGHLVRPLNICGSGREIPAADGFIELVSYDIKPGRAVLVNLVQTLLLSAAATEKPTNRVWDGLTWKAVLGSRDSSDRKTRTLLMRSKDSIGTGGSAEIPWTYVDGSRPVVRGLVVQADGQYPVLVFGVDVDVSEVEAGVVGYSARIEGYDVPSELLEKPEIFQLLGSL